MSKPKKTIRDPEAARIAAEVGEELNQALAGIDLRSLGMPKKPPARRPAPPPRRKQVATLRHVQQTLFDKGADQ
jgi:hypothetical protein